MVLRIFRVVQCFSVSPGWGNWFFCSCDIGQILINGLLFRHLHCNKSNPECSTSFLQPWSLWKSFKGAFRVAAWNLSIFSFFFCQLLTSPAQTSYRKYIWEVCRRGSALPCRHKSIFSMKLAKRLNFLFQSFLLDKTAVPHLRSQPG